MMDNEGWQLTGELRWLETRHRRELGWPPVLQQQWSRPKRDDSGAEIMACRSQLDYEWRDVPVERDRDAGTT